MLHVAAVLWGAAVSPAAQASDFYKITVLAESSQSAGADRRLLPGGISRNNFGVAAWEADRFVSGAFERGISFGDGVSQILVASGSVSNPSINNGGQSAYSSGNEVVLWQPGGGVQTLCTSQFRGGCQPQTLADNGPVAGTGALGNWTLSIVQPIDHVVATGNLDIQFNPFGPIWTPLNINRAGTMAVEGAARGQDMALVAISTAGGKHPKSWRIGTRGANDDGSPVLGGFQSAAVNDRGVIAFSARNGGDPNFDGLVGIVDTRAAVPTVVTLAAAGMRPLRDFFAVPSISNHNEVAFKADLQSGGNGVFVANGAHSPPLAVVATGDTIAADGTTFSFTYQFGSAQMLNDMGQVAFSAGIYRNGQGNNAILRADPVAGISPDNPILPAAGDELPDGGWTIRTRGWGQRATTVIDTAEALDPAGHAFVTGLTVVAEFDVEFGIRMIPITAVPEPGTWALMLQSAAADRAATSCLRRQASRSAACAAASRATGTRNGEQLT